MELAMAYHECRPVITGENDGENLSMIDCQTRELTTTSHVPAAFASSVAARKGDWADKRVDVGK